LATSGDLNLATSEDFCMATDTSPVPETTATATEYGSPRLQRSLPLRARMHCWIAPINRDPVRLL